MVDSLSYFSFQPVAQCSMTGICYPVSGMVNIKTVAANQPMWFQWVSSLAEWFFSMCLMPYNCK